MRKSNECELCHCSRGDEYICDTCGTELTSTFYGIPITISFSYGHELDGSEYHFCNYSCLLKFIVQELRKQPIKDDRFEYGKDME